MIYEVMLLIDMQNNRHTLNEHIISTIHSIHLVEIMMPSRYIDTRPENQQLFRCISAMILAFSVNCHLYVFTFIFTLFSLLPRVLEI